MSSQNEDQRQPENAEQPDKDDRKAKVKTKPPGHTFAQRGVEKRG